MLRWKGAADVRESSANKIRLVALAASCALMTGCASTGAPRPPSLHLPQPVRDLVASRVGGHVDLDFTVPTLSTDRQPLAGRHGGGTLTAVLCRTADASAVCTTIHSQPVTAGAAVQYRDDLPPALLAGSAIPLRYGVRILNAEGRFAGDARQAVTAAGTAPPSVEALAGATTARGVQLTWKPSAADPATTIVIEAVSGETHRNLTVAGDPGGAIDTAPRVGQTVTYTVVRREVLAGPTRAELRGNPATVTLTRTADTFPPAVPRGLAAVPVQMEGVAPEIDLSWEPNGESDLVGYLVERADANGADSPRLLTPAPITAVSYRDLAVQPGHTYRYTVRAEDTAGNRSKAGTAAVESLQP